MHFRQVFSHRYKVQYHTHGISIKPTHQAIIHQISKSLFKCGILCFLYYLWRLRNDYKVTESLKKGVGCYCPPEDKIRTLHWMNTGSCYEPTLHLFEASSISSNFMIHQPLSCHILTRSSQDTWVKIAIAKEISSLLINQYSISDNGQCMASSNTYHCLEEKNACLTVGTWPPLQPVSTWS
jgi:hypothetical protein